MSEETKETAAAAPAAPGGADDAEKEHKVPPAGCEPMTIKMSNMDKYGLKMGDRLSDVVPFKLFNKEEVMAEIRAVGFYSDFHPFSAQLEKYPREEVMVLADTEYVYGKNWLICLTPEALDRELAAVKAAEDAVLEAKRAAEEEAERKRREEEELEKRQYEDLPLTPGLWESDTMEETVEDVRLLSVHPKRPLLALNITRKRREFTSGGWKFNDRDADHTALTEYRQHKDPGYELRRRVLDVGLQAVADVKEEGSQTNWFRLVNNATQYEAMDGARARAAASAAGGAGSAAAGAAASVVVGLSASSAAGGKVELDGESKDAAVGGDDDGPPDVGRFLAYVRDRCEEALQQNETVDIFRDEFAALGDEELSLGVKSKGAGSDRLRTFTDLEYRNRSISCVDWHPKAKGVVAVSCTDNLTFDERVELAGKVRTAFILIWNFADLIHPQLVLTSPHEVFKFAFNPSNPNIIAGGTTTGQVIMWDLTEAQELLKKKGKALREGEEADKTIPPIQPAAMSTIDNSHRRHISDLCWLPHNMETTSKGEIRRSTDGNTYQLATIASDGQLLVWDIRYKEIAAKRAHSARHAEKEAATGETPWNPTFRVVLNHPKGIGELGLAKFVLAEDGPSSRFIVTTEEGEIAVADWSARAEGDEPPAYVQSSTRDHFRPCIALQRSPFFHDIILSVGDFTFNVWKEGMATPIFSSPLAASYLTAGRWSPTRPGVLFISKADGAIDVWDLTDQSHKPSTVLPIASSRLESMAFWDNSSVQQFLGVGDHVGNLHILEVPRNLRRPINNEQLIMAGYFDREVKRVEYVKMRMEVRRSEKESKDAALPRDAEGDEESKAETDRRQAELDEEVYRQLERKFKEQLGLDIEGERKEDASPLPTRARTATSRDSSRPASRGSPLLMDEVDVDVGSRPPSAAASGGDASSAAGSMRGFRG